MAHPTTTTDRRRTLRPGFTLPEATMALVILGIAAAGVLLPFSGGVAVQAEGVHRTLATELANDLMERVIATPYEQIMAGWNGYAEAQGEVKDVTGVILADPMYDKYSRSVACCELWMPPQIDPRIPANFLLVMVEVRRQGRQMVSLSSLVSR